MAQLTNRKDDSLNAVVERAEKYVATLNEMTDGYANQSALRSQKNIGVLYWDFPKYKKEIGKVLMDKGYADVCVKMLNSLIEQGIFTNDDIWFPTYYTYNTLWNYSDAIPELAVKLTEVGLAKILIGSLSHQPYLDGMDKSKNVKYLMKSSLSIVHNLARQPDCRNTLRECNTAAAMKPFTTYTDEFFRALAMLTLAYVLDEEEYAALHDDVGVIKFLVKCLNAALNDTKKRRYRGFTPAELAQGLTKLAVNDANKKKILDDDALPNFVRMMDFTDVDEQHWAARAVWNLSFDEESRHRIAENKNCLEALEKLKKSEDKKVKKCANGALWIINKENEKQETESEKKDDGEHHIFISYNWSHQKTILQIKDKLVAAGHKVWIDVEQMGGSTLQAMAEAVENASVVLICMSEKYKESPNCRTEAEYTFTKRKEIIPLMLQRGYKPDGWLGMILGAKLFIDFSGKYPFEKKWAELAKELHGKVKQDPSNNDVAQTVPGAGAAPPTARAATAAMTVEAVQEWLKSNGLDSCKGKFSGYDGTLLAGLQSLRAEAPEFFYKSLESKYHLDMKEIIRLSDALSKL